MRTFQYVLRGMCSLLYRETFQFSWKSIEVIFWWKGNYEERLVIIYNVNSYNFLHTLSLLLLWISYVTTPFFKTYAYGFFVIITDVCSCSQVINVAFLVFALGCGNVGIWCWMISTWQNFVTQRVLTLCSSVWIPIPTFLWNV